MNRRYVVAAAFLGIAACATSGPESAAPDATSPVPDAKFEAPITSGNPAAAEGPIEDVEVPKVPQAASVPAQPEVVCRREKATGSHRVTRVCTTRTQIARRRTEDQDAMKKVINTPNGTGPN